MTISKSHITFLLAVLLLSSCYNNSFLSGQNRAQLYLDETELLNIPFQFFHINDSITKLVYQVDEEDLLFTKQGNGEMQGKFILIADKHTSYSSRVPFSSDTLANKIFSAGFGSFIDTVDVNFYYGNSYLLELTFRDVKRDYNKKKLTLIHKTNRNSPHYFHAINDSNTYFQKYITVGDSLQLAHNEIKSTSIYVRYYNRNFLLAPPPYAVYNQSPFDFSPDSTFYYTQGANFVFDKEGIYHFQIDQNQAQGYTVIVTRKNFPNISKVEQMLEPLRFLTTNKEFEKLNSTNRDSLKRNIDAFWLNLGKDGERTRQLIKTYYGRVERANKLFTSYTDGWRTDRGMIYTIFGAPNILYQNENGETWVYGKESSPLSFTFSFNKVINPFSENDYSLNRSNMYRYSWSQALGFWLQGRIFNSNTARQEQQYYERQEPTLWY